MNTDRPASQLYPIQGPDMDEVESMGIESALEDVEVLNVVEHFYRGHYSETELVEQLMKLLSQHTRRAEEHLEGKQRSEDDYPSEDAS